MVTASCRHWFSTGTLLLLAALLAGCASQPMAQLEPVGPVGAGKRTGEGDGRLRVFTAGETFTSGEVDYVHHSSYRITSADGGNARFIRNHMDDKDTRPQLVELPAGEYHIIARAEEVGMVNIPVRIEALKTTEIHLEHGWKAELGGRAHSDLVLLPNGRAVGWRAPGPTPENIDENKARRADAVVKVKLVRAPDTFGKVAYSLVQPVALLRTSSEIHLNNQFTVGYTNITQGVASGVSVIYLQQFRRSDGLTEWRLVED